MVAVKVNRFEGPGSARNLECVGAAFDLGAHLLRSLDKADVALDGSRANAADVDAVAGVGTGGNGAQGHKVAGRRGIALDMDFAWRLVTATGRDGEALPAFALHLNAKARQQIQGDLNVRLGNQFASDFEANVPLGHQRQRHQQRC